MLMDLQKHLQRHHRSGSLAFEGQGQACFTQTAIDGDRGENNQTQYSGEMQGQLGQHR